MHRVSRRTGGLEIINRIMWIKVGVSRRTGGLEISRGFHRDKTGRQPPHRRLRNYVDDSDLVGFMSAAAQAA